MTKREPESQHTPDESKLYICSISGGKDSVAMWLYLRFDLGLNVIPIFADTGWEHAITYDYLDYLDDKFGGLIKIQGPYTMITLAKKKKRFPSPRVRFCTQELKLFPLKKYIWQMIEDGKLDKDKIIMCSGVRAEESPSRAKMAPFMETDDLFKLPQWRPILDWTWQEVFAMHSKHGIEPNPLYKHGMSRVGCMPCIMVNKSELAQIARRFPEVFDQVQAAEDTVMEISDHSSFWTPDFIPERFSSREWTNPKDGKLWKIPRPHDVKRYVLMTQQERKYGSFELFHEPQNEDLEMCSSIYGLCE